MNKIVGKIIFVGQTQVLSDKFQKREFALETSEKYPQKILFQLVNDKCVLLDNVKQNETIEVAFNINGREWAKDGVTRYFNTLNAWSIVYPNINQTKETKHWSGLNGDIAQDMVDKGLESMYGNDMPF